MNQRYDDLHGGLEDTIDELAEVTSTLDLLNDMLLELDEKLMKEEALEMLESHLANPDAAIVTDMTDELFEELLGDLEFNG